MTYLSPRRQFELVLGHDFYSFFRQVFGTLHPNLAYEEAWHVEVICSENGGEKVDHGSGGIVLLRAA